MSDTEVTEHRDCHGQVEFRLPDGTVIGLAANWNDGHRRGNWLAQWKPLDWRDSGLKRFKTARGAIGHVRKKLSAPKIAVDVSA